MTVPSTTDAPPFPSRSNTGHDSIEDAKWLPNQHHPPRSRGSSVNAPATGSSGGDGGRFAGMTNLNKSGLGTRKSSEAPSESLSGTSLRKVSLPSSMSKLVGNSSTVGSGGVQMQDGRTGSTPMNGSLGQDGFKTSMTDSVSMNETGYITNTPLSSSPPAMNPSPLVVAQQSSSSTLHVTGQQSSRFSSPPILSPSTGSGSTQLPAPSTSSRQQQRHTLQIPRVTRAATSPIATRSEQDILTSAGTSSAARDPSRFSPTTAVQPRRASVSLVRRPTRSINSDMHFEDLPPDDEQAKWIEAIKAKRASKRKRKEEEDDDRVLVGTKVDQNHVNWVTAYNMLTGIRFTVSRTNAKLDRELTDADFTARHKFSFDITGNELTPSAKYDFKFKDYAPWVFRSLRQKFGLDPADYLVSLTSKYILSELGSPGKSGSFFYFSRDYKYIIKTIHHGEHRFLRKILKEYYNHIVDNPNTLVSQFYGLHRVKIPFGRKIHFVVMNNLFPPHRDIHVTFDLKGSTVGRDYKEDKVAENPRATLKDLNWLRRHMHLQLGHQKREEFLEQVKRDMALLQRLKIMDYSLLIGIHNLSRGNKDNIRENTLKVFQPGGEVDPFDGPPAQPGSAPDLQGIAGSVSSFGDRGGMGSMLVRTPSKLEASRKARELRKMIKAEMPTRLGSGNDWLPDDILREEIKGRGIFYQDDGGLRATHEDGAPGDAVYYLGIIDCLTRYNFIKRMEHFLKGFKYPKNQISATDPQYYGERFFNFISGVTMSPEQEQEEEAATERKSEAVSGRRISNASATGIAQPTGRTSTSAAGVGVGSPIMEEGESSTSVAASQVKSSGSRREGQDAQARASAEHQLQRNIRAQQKIDARKGTSPPVATAWDRQKLEEGTSPVFGTAAAIAALATIKGSPQSDKSGGSSSAPEKSTTPSSPTYSAAEDEPKDRTLATVRTPSISGQGGGTILPVVKEQSTESLKSKRSSQEAARATSDTNLATSSSTPPPLPAKDRPSRESLRNGRPLTSSGPVSRSRSVSRDKPLPPDPPTSIPDAPPLLPPIPQLDGSFAKLSPKVKVPGPEKEYKVPIKVHQPPITIDGEKMAEIVKMDKAKARTSDIVGHVQKVRTP